MRRLFCLIALLLLAHTGLAQDAFEKGNGQYNNGQFAEAAASYESILKAGRESAAVYFNLGNAYFEMDSLAPAIYNYEKALQLEPGNKDVKVNLAFANNKVTGDITEAPQGGLSKFLAGAAGAYHYDTWAWISVSFSVIFLLLFCGYYFSKPAVIKRSFFAGMCVAFIIIITGLLTAIFARDKAANERPAIVYANLAVVKAEPSATAGDAMIVHEGTKVYVDEEKGSWKKITLADDTTGWIESSAIRELR